jgi:hypothetical protein
VSILIEQNKETIVQNKKFIRKENRIEDKYINKIQKFIFMLLLDDKKCNYEDS